MVGGWDNGSNVCLETAVCQSGMETNAYFCCASIVMAGVMINQYPATKNISMAARQLLLFRPHQMILDTYRIFSNLSMFSSLLSEVCSHCMGNWLSRYVL